jgi:hypothetical protein
MMPVTVFGFRLELQGEQQPLHVAATHLVDWNGPEGWVDVVHQMVAVEPDGAVLQRRLGALEPGAPVRLERHPCIRHQVEALARKPLLEVALQPQRRRFVADLLCLPAIVVADEDPPGALVKSNRDPHYRTA